MGAEPEGAGRCLWAKITPDDSILTVSLTTFSQQRKERGLTCSLPSNKPSWKRQDDDSNIPDLVATAQARLPGPLPFAVSLTPNLSNLPGDLYLYLVSAPTCLLAVLHVMQRSVQNLGRAHHPKLLPLPGFHPPLIPPAQSHTASKPLSGFLCCLSPHYSQPTPRGRL